MEDFTSHDVEYMREALALARNGEGRVSPNPPVGCVLVKDGAIVGRGWHDRLGERHAEANALLDAGPKAEGATAYITLSPCNSTGRQPPCSDALIKAGVAKVIAAVEDPNPKNNSGLEKLRRAGISVASGLLRDEGAYLARGFFKIQQTGLPWLTLKYAMTMDGKIAAAGGDSRWVSGEKSRLMVQDMRSRNDAVIIGSGTALADNPALTVREPVWSERGGSARHRQPLRVVVDSRLRISPQSALLATPQPGQTDPPGGEVVIATVAAADAERKKALANAGATVVELPALDGSVDPKAVLHYLADRGVNNVLCEGGGELAASLIRQKMVDEVVAFVACKLIGGGEAPGPVADLGLRKMADAVWLGLRECKIVDQDIVITAQALY